MEVFRMISTTIPSRASAIAEHQKLLVMHSGIGLVTFTGPSGVGKNHAAGMVQRMFGGGLVESIVTRILRKGQDSEYRKVSDDQFDGLEHAHKFLWWVWGDERTELTRDADMRDDMLRDRYGTLGEDIDLALEQEAPSVMHLVHERVAQLQEYVNVWGKGRKVFSFAVACKCDKMVRRRIIARQPDLDPKVVDRRVANFYERQNSYLQSGLYNGLIVSRDDKSDAELQEELEFHLTHPIPTPRKFLL